MEPGALVGAIGSGIGVVETVWNRVMGRLEGLDIEMRGLCFRDVSKSDSVFIIITPHPISYIANLQISNGTPRRRGIKSVELLVEGQAYTWAEDDVEPFDSGDVRAVQWTFPALGGSPKAGRYTIKITDSSGKTRKIEGAFTSGQE